MDDVDDNNLLQARIKAEKTREAAFQDQEDETFDIMVVLAVVVLAG